MQNQLCLNQTSDQKNCDTDTVFCRASSLLACTDLVFFGLLYPNSPCVPNIKLWGIGPKDNPCMIHWTEQLMLRLCGTLLQCNTHCVMSVLLCSEILVERSPCSGPETRTPGLYLVPLKSTVKNTIARFVCLR